MLTICKLIKAKAKQQNKNEMSDDEESTLQRKGSKSKVGAQKFTQGTKAYQRLKKLFESKEILPTDKPADVRQKDALFMDFTNQQFPSQFNKLESIHGTCTKEG
jgi:hypothetical protein